MLIVSDGDFVDDPTTVGKDFFAEGLLLGEDTALLVDKCEVEGDDPIPAEELEDGLALSRAEALLGADMRTALEGDDEYLFEDEILPVELG